MSVKLELGFTGASREREQIARDPILYSILAPSVVFPSLLYKSMLEKQLASLFAHYFRVVNLVFLSLQVLKQ
jgi:hypothetical protein